LPSHLSSRYFTAADVEVLSLRVVKPFLEFTSH